MLAITDLDPLRFGLIFERFLNPERVSPPDIDVDFCQNRRGEVIEYVRQKYGDRAVSQIITFGTLGAKSVVRDVGRVLGLSYSDADRIAKMIPNELGITLSSAYEKNPELKQAVDTEESTQQLWGLTTLLEGLTRNTRIHAAGVVIGDKPLDEYIPLCRGNDDEVVTQYAMGPLTDLGMLKMDFLGLKTLTVLDDAAALIRQSDAQFSLENISLEDRSTFDLLNRGETIGVFQLESGGMTNLCKQFDVNAIGDIIALIALSSARADGAHPGLYQAEKRINQDQVRTSASKRGLCGHIRGHDLSGTGATSGQCARWIHTGPGRSPPARNGQKGQGEDGKGARQFHRRMQTGK